MAPQTQQELLSWYGVIIKQNYFTHDNQIIFQHDGVAMGAPSSGLITEIFLQHIEHSHITDLTQKHRIINYCRYVDDILIIFDPNQSDIQKILNDFNSIHLKLRFTAETENNCTLNFLDLSIHRTPTGLRTAIFRKPTFTDTIILFTSNQSIQHKYAAVRYLYNRLESYKLQQKEYQQELNIIHKVLHNNSFPIKPQKPPISNPDKPLTTHTTQKWDSFTYIGRETTYITNIFKRTDLKITFRTTQTIANLLTHKDMTNTPYQEYTN
jgi:hypothetical protein